MRPFVGPQANPASMPALSFDTCPECLHTMSVSRLLPPHSKSTTPGPGIYEPDEWEDEIVMMSSPRGRSSGQTPRGSPPSRQGAAPSPRVTQKQSPRSQSPPRQPVDNSSPRSIPRDSAGTSSPSVVATASPAVQHVLEAEGVAVVRRPASPGRRATVASGGMDRSQSPVRRGSDASRSSMPRRDSFNRHFLNSPVVEEISKKEEEDKKVVQAREEQAQREAQRKQQVGAQHPWFSWQYSICLFLSM